MIEYSNTGWLGGLLCKWRGSVVPSAAIAAIPSACVAVAITHVNREFDDFRENVSIEAVKASTIWSALLATLSVLIGFRTNKAYARFWDGTTLLHQMWGEWFDAVSCLVAFSTLARRSKPQDVWEFRHTLVRLMSLCHGSAMEEIAETTDDPQGYPALDIGGLDQITLKYLRDCKFDQNLDFNRVEVIIHMIQTLIVNAHDTGVLKIPPPILSRVFQTLSRGQVNLMNCKKITHTLFPFPYAQLIAILLLAVAMLSPVAMAAVCQEEQWAFVFTLLPVFGLFALNYVARELEMPFGNDFNDLPLLEFQNHMNNSLLMLIREETDHVPGINHNVCSFEFNRIKSKISTARPREFVIHEDTTKEHKALNQSRAAPPMAPAPLEPPAAPPAPAPAAPAPLESKMMALEQVLQKSVTEFGDKFTDLKESTGSLSSQLGHNTQVMSEFSRDIRELLTKAQRTPVAPGSDAQIRARPAINGALSGCCEMERPAAQSDPISR